MSLNMSSEQTRRNDVSKEIQKRPKEKRIEKRGAVGCQLSVNNLAIAIPIYTCQKHDCHAI